MTAGTAGPLAQLIIIHQAVSMPGVIMLQMKLITDLVLPHLSVAKGEIKRLQFLHRDGRK